MKIEIDNIIISSDRRPLATKGVDELVKSMAQVGLLNPITVDRNNHLIAGRQRLEAAKLLGWTEIECTVTDLDGLKAELAEIDENVTRTNLSGVTLGEVLRRRKEIYEQLHPETKARNRPGHVSNFQSSSDNLTLEAKSFSEDTAEKLGVGKRTVERLVQMATDLTPEAREIIKEAGKRMYAYILADLPRERLVEFSDSIDKINERMRIMLYEVMSIQYERNKARRDS